MTMPKWATSLLTVMLFVAGLFAGALVVAQNAKAQTPTRVFEKHGMTNVGYWVPRDQPNTLVYILAYPSKEVATKAWEGFRKDEGWLAARTASEANGPIVAKVISVFMDPTNFSGLK